MVLGDINWKQFPSKVSGCAKDLLHSIINPSPDNRVGISQIKVHDWFSKPHVNDKVSVDWTRPLIDQPPPFLPQLNDDLDSKYLDDRRRPHEGSIPNMIHLPKIRNNHQDDNGELFPNPDPIDSLINLEDEGGDDFEGFSMILSGRMEDEVDDGYLKSLSLVADEE